MDKDIEARNKTCRSLGFKDLVEVHEIIAACAKSKDYNWLLRRKLNSKNLTNLGYTPSALKQLGYTDTDLKNIGYDISDSETKIPLTREEIITVKKLKDLVASGCNASQLKAEGYGVHNCKTAGYSAIEMLRLGFPLSELVKEYSVHELKRAGCRVQELRGFFSGRELREAGYAAIDMKKRRIWY